MSKTTRIIGYIQASDKKSVINSLEKLEGIDCDWIYVDYDKSELKFRDLMDNIEDGDTVILINVFETSKMLHKTLKLVEVLEAKKGSLYIGNEEMYNSNEADASVRKNMVGILASMIETVEDYKERHPEFKSELPSKLMSKILKEEPINNVMARMMAECGIQLLKSFENK